MQTICESPDDDTPRLVYADWLEENGLPLLSEFVRAQIALARPTQDDTLAFHLKKRESELWSQRRKWGRLPPNWTHLPFESYSRGFIEIWTGTFGEFRRTSAAFWSYGPIRIAVLLGTGNLQCVDARFEFVVHALDTVDDDPGRQRHLPPELYLRLRSLHNSLRIEDLEAERRRLEHEFRLSFIQRRP